MNNLRMEYSIERLAKTLSPIKTVRLFSEAPSGKLRLFVIPIWGQNISGHLPSASRGVPLLEETVRRVLKE